MTEAEQDEYLAEWLVDGFESGQGRSAYGWTLSAVQKVNPRASFRTAWRVYDAWGVQAPPHQAPAAPPELLTAMMIAALLLNRPQLSLVMLFCYAGLLRVRESLNLACGDVFRLPDSVVLCLGLTKRGMEQKVVMQHASVVRWASCYFQRFPEGAAGAPVFSISYASVLRWIKKLAALLGAESLQLTTHSLRRSGASELSRQGVPLADILLYGRWLRERSAREYIRRGEVAVLRAKSMLDQRQHLRWQRWNSLFYRAWHLYDMLHQRRALLPSWARLNQSKFDLFEECVVALHESTCQ